MEWLSSPARGLPLVVVSFNNRRYLAHTLETLGTRFPRLLPDVVVLDSASSDAEALEALAGYERRGLRVYRSAQNLGPWPWKHEALYNWLPDRYLLTDADLEWNPRMPPDFEQRFAEVAERLGAARVGVALRIDDADLFFDSTYHQGMGVRDWERQFWAEPVAWEGLSLYRAHVDTTLALHVKSAQGSENEYRLAGDFTARHLPWYVEDPVATFRERHLTFASQASSSIGTTKALFLAHLASRGIRPVEKRGTTLLVHVGKDPGSEEFWASYPMWEDANFAVYDSVLTPGGTFVDVGAWNGCTAIYAAQRCRRVVSVEVDPGAAAAFLENVRLNCRDVELVQKAICAMGRPAMVPFGRNEACPSHALNKSVSQARANGEAVFEDDFMVPTTTLAEVLTLAEGPVDLVKVDIEGGEEDLMPELLALRGTRILLSFHYDWWKDRDLTRFDMEDDLREAVASRPFATFTIMDGQLLRE
jgi:FkbM family methyltransferase